MLFWISSQYYLMLDVSKNQIHSLSAESKTILSKLKAKISFKVFFAKHANNTKHITSVLDQKTIRNFFSRFKHYDQNIDVQYFDSTRDLLIAKKYKVKRSQEIVVMYGDRFKSISKLDESVIMNALLQLSYNRETWVAFLQGHGEKSPYKELSKYAKMLKQHKTHVQTINLLRTKTIPKNTSLIVIAAPKQNLALSEIRQLLRYINQGGNLLWLHDPGFSPGMDLISARLGIEIIPGVVLDSQLSGKHAAYLVINDYPKNNRIASDLFGGNTVFPVSSALKIRKSNRANPFQFQELLRSSSRSWSETQLNNNKYKQFNFDTADRKGPFTLAYALTRKINNKKNTQRIVVIGDSDFLSNRYIENGANQQFAINLFHWLSHYDELISIQSAPRRDTALDLNYQQILTQAFIFVCLIPFFLFISAYYFPRRRLSRLN